MLKGFLKKVLSVAMVTSLAVTAFGSNVYMKPSATVRSDFGVGQGKKIPSQIFAPFLDFCDYFKDGEYQANGAPYMPRISQDTGIMYYNLAFIQACGKQVIDEKVNWAWAGLSLLKEGSQDPQYLGMKKSIKDFRDMGGEVIISFGGRDGVALWQATDNPTYLYNTYKEIVDGYGCTRIDLDIEGGAQGKEENRTNAKAIKMLQDATGVEVTLTVPVLPSGLTEKQLDVLEVYLTEGVEVTMVNIMAMCYGPNALNPGENYGTGSVRAIDSTMKQIKEYYKKYLGVFLTDADAYRKVGVTTSVGFESNYDPLFPPEWTQLVTDHAIDKEIGMNSFWSINRDSKLQPNSGIDKPYEHTMIARKFADPNHNFIPEFKGVNERRVQVGTEFNPLKGVSAFDREDGDISNKITVEGKVDTTKVGTYELTYKVIDSKDGQATVKRKIIVVNEEVINSLPQIKGAEDKDIIKGIPFDALGGVTVYDEEEGDITASLKVEGTVDTNTLGDYLVVYSVEDSDGGKTVIPMVVTVINKEDYVEEFDYYKVYTGGELVWYKGVKYQCTSWTTYGYPDASPWAWKVIDTSEDNILNLSKAAAIYNSKLKDIDYNAKLDINRDCMVDIYDLTALAKKIK